MATPKAPAIPLGPPGLPPIPSPAAVQTAMQTFLTGTPPGIGLTTSPNPGTALFNTTPTITTTSLPPLGITSAGFLAPVNQPIYDLNKFVNQPDVGEDTIGISSTGAFTLRRNTKKISSPDEWVSAAGNFGVALSLAPTEPEWNLPDFTAYVQLISAYFRTHTFSSVLSFEQDWRRWRRAGKFRWSETNFTLAAITLIHKPNLQRGLAPERTALASAAPFPPM